MARSLVAVAPALSVTCTVKLADAPVALPPICPAASSVSPAGSDPVRTAHRYDPEPPLAERVCEYGAPCSAVGSDWVVIVSVGALMVSDSAFDAVTPLASRACTVKLAVPADVGVPASVPSVPSDNPAGSDPAVTDQVNPPVPPVAVSVCA